MYKVESIRLYKSAFGTWHFIIIWNVMYTTTAALVVINNMKSHIIILCQDFQFCKIADSVLAIRVGF